MVVSCKFLWEPSTFFYSTFVMSSCMDVYIKGLPLYRYGTALLLRVPCCIINCTSMFLYVCETAACSPSDPLLMRNFWIRSATFFYRSCERPIGENAKPDDEAPWRFPWYWCNGWPKRWGCVVLRRPTFFSSRRPRQCSCLPSPGWFRSKACSPILLVFVWYIYN